MMTRERAATILYNKWQGFLEEHLEWLLKTFYNKPCEDCISREEVINKIKEYFHDDYYQRTSIQDCRDCLIEDVILNLPGIHPTKTKGEEPHGKIYDVEEDEDPYAEEVDIGGVTFWSQE